MLTFVLFYGKKGEGDRHPVDCVLFPAPNHSEFPLHFPEALPGRIRRALSDAEQTFKAGHYSPSVTAGRRAMEGIFKHLAPEEKRDAKLYDLINLVCSSEDIAKPLLSLSHVIREGGNLGAHFDQETDTDEETAQAILELLHYLISYFFLLPEKTTELEGKLKAPSQNIEGSA